MQVIDPARDLKNDPTASQPRQGVEGVVHFQTHPDVVGKILQNVKTQAAGGCGYGPEPPEFGVILTTLPGCLFDKQRCRDNGAQTNAPGNKCSRKTADPECGSAADTRKNHAVAGLFERGRDDECRAVGFLNPPSAGPGDAENDAHEGESGDAVVIRVGGQEAFVERGGGDHSDRQHRSAERAETAGGEGCKEGQGYDEK